MKITCLIRTQFKTSYHIFVVIIFNSFLTAEICAQEISTVAEIYNYDVGDIFHTRFYEEIDGYWWESISSRTITNKYYSQDNDTVFYTADVIRMERETYPPDWEWSQYTVSFHYTKLDSLVNNGNIDTVYTDEELYNGRVINFYEVDNEPNTNNKWRYVNGCGRTYHTYHGYGFGSSISEIVYYNKSGEEWGEPILILGQEEMDGHSGIWIYPNPASERLNIKTEGIKFEWLTVFSTNGTQLLSQGVQSNSFSIGISDLSPGTYMISLAGKGNTFTEVFIKE